MLNISHKNRPVLPNTTKDIEEILNDCVSDFDKIIHFDPMSEFVNFIKNSHERLNVIFSTARPKKDYASLSVGEVKTKILKNWELDGESKRKVEIILKRIDCKDLFFEYLNPISEIIAEANNNDFKTGCDCGRIKAIIRAWITNIDGLILGTYSNRERKITLFVKAIEQKAKDNMFLTQLYKSVFSHELFHAFHYYFAKTQNSAMNFDSYDILMRFDYTGTVMKESLASFFEYQFCDKFKIDSDVANGWFYGPEVYPYAGAGYIAYEEDDFEEFIEILKLSAFDFDAALRYMLPYEIFCNVKNTNRKNV